MHGILSQATRVEILPAGYQGGMTVLVLILLIFGLVCFLVAAFAPAVVARPALVPLGLAAWILTAVIGAAQSVGA